MAKPPRIVIFAKAPVAGLAKTRLIPALGAQGAARLAAVLLSHAVEQALASGVGPVELCMTPAPHDPLWSGLVPQTLLTWSDQGDGDLGARMARAAQRALEAGEPVLLMGTDCPDLTAGRIREAAASLIAADATLVPAFDGGYVLLGLNHFDASLFAGIAWSTATVAQETRRRVEQLGWSLQNLPTLHDIDEPADLRWLPAHLQPAI
ncbi:MAG: TIGR04282 family arsenosugar biosynthesis glycosyltransferase [Hydrogenophaga sp.]|uniref:TIGR04282 family arsenosugar biosynthesis glycosyltransferase n=1 Tax=Hydrogenophaga sp. TaxID=1904254 RepID=UPI002724D656|nr:TIGR04282 family arsenosugar biosynthesis glycosyltransferase [Hydrogenophaga sp.]MDO9033537.1 TIGR04282 family arsenosugar biosynthesis glycosyltransferase [Hydrogenophaga sp.]